MSFSIGFTPKKKFRLGGGSRTKKLVTDDAKSTSQVSRLINIFERNSAKVHPVGGDSTGATGSLTRPNLLPQQPRGSIALAKRHLKRSINRLLTPKASLKAYRGVGDVMGSDDVFEKNNNDTRSPASAIPTPKLRLWSEIKNNVNDGGHMFKF